MHIKYVVLPLLIAFVVITGCVSNKGTVSQSVQNSNDLPSVSSDNSELAVTATIPPVRSNLSVTSPTNNRNDRKDPVLVSTDSKDADSDRQPSTMIGIRTFTSGSGVTVANSVETSSNVNGVSVVNNNGEMWIVNSNDFSVEYKGTYADSSGVTHDLDDIIDSNDKKRIGAATSIRISLYVEGEPFDNIDNSISS